MSTELVALEVACEQYQLVVEKALAQSATQNAALAASMAEAQAAASGAKSQAIASKFMGAAARGVAQSRGEAATAAAAAAASANANAAAAAAAAAANSDAVVETRTRALLAAVGADVKQLEEALAESLMKVWALIHTAHPIRTPLIRIVPPLSFTGLGAQASRGRRRHHQAPLEHAVGEVDAAWRRGCRRREAHVLHPQADWRGACARSAVARRARHLRRTPLSPSLSLSLSLLHSSSHPPPSPSPRSPPPLSHR